MQDLNYGCWLLANLISMSALISSESLEEKMKEVTFTKVMFM